ncbi:hypothetical protein DCAR_0832045 [Daucus carota subsp. sativus]|uniref:Uncharacterized protein n=1 Tax=Daucus carota subsp. sativus TaxID=79200 RepID=A0A175YNP8_DAUCS|nr:hypothetical protein DCAR_0832045 [Daucus carota subsp. sativus]
MKLYQMIINQVSVVSNSSKWSRSNLSFSYFENIDGCKEDIRRPEKKEKNNQKECFRVPLLYDTCKEVFENDDPRIISFPRERPKA